MVDAMKLKSVIVLRGKTQQDVAINIGMAPKTFYDKVKKGIFGSDEIEAIVEYLEIDEPVPIFFPSWVTSKVTE